MKPLKLELSAFGPYLDKVEIDFTRLDGNGIYLVSGDTGSGKTMIFDAIAFALYNKTSGNNRTSKDLRNVMATDQLTYVDYSFKINSSIARIKRIPAQIQRLADKDKKIAASYQFFLDDQELRFDGDNDIASIVGVNYDEFSQIVMIAQNEFMALITQSDSKRTEILKKLFKIPNMNDFTTMLSQEYGAAKSDHTRFNDNIVDMLELYEFQNQGDDAKIVEQFEQKQGEYESDKKALELQVGELENELAALDKQVREINEINSLFDALKEAIEDKSQLLSSRDITLEDQLSLLKAAAKVKPAHELIQNTSRDIATLVATISNLNTELEGNKEKIKELKKEVDSKELYQQQIRVHQATANELEQKRIQLDKIRSVKDDIAAFTQRNKGLCGKIDTLLENQKNNQTNLAALKQYLEKETDMATGRIKWQNEIDRLTRQATTIQSCLKEKENETRIKEQHLSALKRYETLDDALKQAKLVFAQAQKRKNEYAIGYIASSLKDNEPCPVCGSLNHPQVAPLLESDISQEHLDALQQEQDALQSELNEAVAVAGDLNGRLKNVVEKLETLKQELGNIDDYDLLLEKNRLDLKAANEKMAQINGYFRQLDATKEKQAKLEQAMADDAGALTSHNSEVERLNGVISSLQGQLDELPKISRTQEELENDIRAHQEAAKSLEDRIAANQDSYHLALNQITRIETSLQEKSGQKDQLETANEKNRIGYERELSLLDYSRETIEAAFDQIGRINELESIIEQYNRALVKVESTIELYKAKTQNKQVGDPAVLVDQANLKRDLLAKVKDELATISSRLLTIQNDSTKISQWLKNRQGAQERYQIHYDLYQTAKGSLAGQKKLAFETYLVYSYFEELLEYANVIFSQLTNERYQFVASEPDNKRATSGFVLGILDRENSKTRLARTLSGGETFKAALSLAIGLSRLVQDKSGCVELNSIFIDEGFGTLDDNSLNIAINTLQSIRLEDQMIGIISHVNLLKERIDNKILVRKDNEKSVIEIVEG